MLVKKQTLIYESGVVFFLLQVSLLGVSVRPMCLVLELAPMGSLFGILDKKIASLKEAQEDRVGSSLHMPGGVLGSVVSYRIALQVTTI